MKTKYVILVVIVGMMLFFGVFQWLAWDNLEFRSQRLLDNYRYFSILFYAVLTIVAYYLLPDGLMRQVAQGVGAIAIFILLLLIGFYQVLGIPDNGDIKDDSQVLFVNRKNPRVRIILQSYKTGIHGDHSNFDTVITRSIFHNIRWSRKFDLKNIDTGTWMNVSSAYILP